ncbi:penicillin-insensitive murein endopeptidase [Sandaracinus amylolyticus]|uniref:penicillin-insensitive murein endopeptidase n=1 Tax=Sandaracinus amylolyticus TaxID=927083 RepID=UPI0012ECBC87|nr:penicillin-insensitive murein endopeptidase [Sandaracinus amylolyticus]
MAGPARVPPVVWLALPLVGAALGAVALAFAGEEAGEIVVETRRDQPSPDAGVVVAASTPEDAGTHDPRFAPDGAILAAPSDEDYACLRPALEYPRDPACDEGAPYPRCRWQLPTGRESGGLWRTWRNTTDDHRWARPGLVSLIAATAAEYQRRWPGEVVTVGDLDAAGPRHQTHDRGVDVDLYLEHAMIAQNIGGGRYPDNYAQRSAREVELLRARVIDLAKILATCSGGRLRIYYNDPDLVRDFRAWFEGRGMTSDVGPPMLMHNPLHRFHFHMTVAEDLAVVPAAND